MCACAERYGGAGCSSQAVPGTCNLLLMAAAFWNQAVSLPSAECWEQGGMLLQLPCLGACCGSAIERLVTQRYRT